jgi:hypothetical protein
LTGGTASVASGACTPETERIAVMKTDKMQVKTSRRVGFFISKVIPQSIGFDKRFPVQTTIL